MNLLVSSGSKWQLLVRELVGQQWQQVAASGSKWQQVAAARVYWTSQRHLLRRRRGGSDALPRGRGETDRNDEVRTAGAAETVHAPSPAASISSDSDS